MGAGALKKLGPPDVYFQRLGTLWMQVGERERERERKKERERTRERERKREREKERER